MNPMAITRQAPTSDGGGRVNQKRRTRAAIVETARAILDRGERPTISKVAEEALMSRPTVYRYFPTQESLLMELTVSVSVDEMEELISTMPADASPEARVLDLVEGYLRHMSANEGLYRTAVRHYMDTWLAADQAGEAHDQPVREGRRRRWIDSALGPRAKGESAARRERLVQALSLLIGSEAFLAMRDVCHLDDDEAVAVISWAVQAILAADGDR